MRPFLLLATRSDDVAADGEYAGILRHGGLAPEELHRVRLEAGPVPDVDLDAYSGIILGGSPFNASAPDPSELQRRVEAHLHRLLDAVLAADTPFLGCCYGVGILGTHLGAPVDATYAEAPGAIALTPTAAAANDPLCRALPDGLRGVVGHKEALREAPPGAELLLTGDACPVQMFRVGANAYATQFHPELDAPTLDERLRIYAGQGYCAPDEAEGIVAEVARADLSGSHEILRRFVARYRS